MRTHASFLHLLYLYLWPFWLFRDASRGTMLERAAAYRYNRERRIYLPAYAMKWTVLVVLQTVLILGFEQAASVAGVALLWCAAALGTTASASAVVIVLCLASWGYLTWVEFERT
jgi:hypothetical protein